MLRGQNPENARTVNAAEPVFSTRTRGALTHIVGFQGGRPLLATIEASFHNDVVGWRKRLAWLISQCYDARPAVDAAMVGQVLWKGAWISLAVHASKRMHPRRTAELLLVLMASLRMLAKSREHK